MKNTKRYFLFCSALFYFVLFCFVFLTVKIWKSYIWTADKDVNAKAILAVVKKHSGLYRVWTHDLYRCNVLLTELTSQLGANKTTESWSSCWFYTTREVMNKWPWIYENHVCELPDEQLPVGLPAPLVDCCTGIAEVMGSNPVQARICFFSL